MKRIFGKTKRPVVLAALAALSLGGCGKPDAGEDILKVGLVVDQGQITADTFQYAVWQGLEAFAESHENVQLRYLESETEDEYLANFDQLADEGCALIFGSGFLLEDAIVKAAELNENIQYALLDTTFEEEELTANLAGIDFSSEIPAFLAGYIAGNVTESGKIGFVGGISSSHLDRFEYGYRYGAAYAGKELGKEVAVEAVYTGTFIETVVGKNAALELYENGCDVVFQAAGECGLGVFEAAKFMDGWAIGADVDQYEEAPANVLTSALKQVENAVYSVAEEFAGGKTIGGKNHVYGLEEDAVGIPKENPNLTELYPGVYEKAMELEEKIRTGGLTVPADKETLEQLLGQL